MPKAKSLTILGVRGLKVHERTPGLYAREYIERHHGWMALLLIAQDAAVQAMLWWGDFKYRPSAYDVARNQAPKWRDVFDRAMRRYEKEQKR